MCGLVGLVQRFDPQARIDLAPLERGLEALAAWNVDQDDAATALEGLAEALDAFSLALVGWAGFRSLREDAALARRVGELAQLLNAAADAVEARLADAARVDSTELGEALARAVVATRDVAWRLERDALPAQEAAAGLRAGDADPGTKGWFELWRINLILNQLGRLEVRGRDSGGLATLITFTPDAWTAARGALSPELIANLDARRAIDCLRDRAVLVLEGEAGVSLAFAHKVAREVGELGANVRDLRAALRADALYQALLGREDARVQVMAHTRWASNGVISEPNCHPVANDLVDQPLERIVLGVLNGDVDNYPTLAQPWAIPADCTTDAKIIPLEVAEHQRQGRDLPQALQAAASGFHGSTAIAVLGSDDPDRTAISLKGSGQAIYVGRLVGDEPAWIYASELYGVVEVAPTYFKLDGERGQVAGLQEGQEPSIYALDGGSEPPPSLRPAPIATRDIDRGGYSHYFLKEINEAPRSVERTLRGKFVLEDGRARFLLGEEVIPTAVRAGMQAKTIRKIFVIGQGTAAVAGIAASEFMSRLLSRAGIEVRGMPATELSGFYLDQLGPGCLVVAVSQSGTTTDTNRTVDLAKERGAVVLGIVNRRGSDLADKSHGVLYTSDGRDVEMSVASTKAFYCQVVAGYLLALNLAQLAGAIDGEELASRLLRLGDLPRCLRVVLEESRERIRQAAQLAIRRKHWTVVGSGPLFQAAREVRIKLSELCYKSVSVDTIEDKKHIDLSSEPLILVCAAGLNGPAAADAVKEVAIFKAHAAAPVVICDRGETRFSDYAQSTITVPASTPEVSLLLTTIAGHLFSYETARAIDACAEPLRTIRDATDAALAALPRDAEPDAVAHTIVRYKRALTRTVREVGRQIEAGEWNAAIGAGTALRLLKALTVGMGELAVTELHPHQSQQVPPSAREVFEHVQAQVTLAIDGLRRPIDAIKHQAKTVTVGISREAQTVRPAAGLIVRHMVTAGAPADAISDQDAAALASLEPAIADCLGVVRYRLEHLSPLGAPTDASRIVVECKTGVAKELSSRAEGGAPLRGTKRSLVRAPRVYVGHGQSDGRSLLICPLYRAGVMDGLALLHVAFRSDLDVAGRVRALRAVGRYEDVKCAVTEFDVVWSDGLLETVSIEALLADSVDKLSETLRAAELSPTSEGTP